MLVLLAAVDDSPGRRCSLLFDMDVAIQQLGATNALRPSVVSLAGVYHNLLREWADR